MRGYTLKLQPKVLAVSPLYCQMMEKVPYYNHHDFFSQNIDEVYADARYCLTLECEDSPIPSEIELYVNGQSVRIAHHIENYSIIMDSIDNQYPEGQLFRDCFGYVRIELYCISEDKEFTLFSKFFAVMVRQNLTNESVRKMAEFVYTNHRVALGKRNVQPSDTIGLTESEKRSLEAEISIMKLIARVYEGNFRYFKSNSKFKIVTENRIDDFEKLRFVSADTLRYIAQNPNDLVHSLSQTGVKYNGINMQPLRTMLIDNATSHDIYENRVLVGFLHTVIISLDGIISKVNELKNLVPKRRTSVDAYISSAYFIYESTRQTLEAQTLELIKVHSDLQSIYWMYRQSLKVQDIVVSEVPRPTPIFRGVLYYRQMFDLMQRWFSSGHYDFESEEFMLPFLVNNKLYEFYSLLKLIYGIEAKGFVMHTSSRYHYRLTDKRFVNTECVNTFAFSRKEGEELTLYYQPVIFGQRYSESGSNGIKLFRNTSIYINRSYDNELDAVRPLSRSVYYTPDYVIKYDYAGCSRYFILDAKFQTVDCVKRFQVPELAFKYLFSISTVIEDDEIYGFCAITGKSIEKNTYGTIYDIAINSRATKPVFGILTLSENEHDTYIDHQYLIGTMLEGFLE